MKGGEKIGAQDDHISADRIHNRHTVKSEIINDNMTEAAGRELYKEFKNK